MHKYKDTEDIKSMSKTKFCEYCHKEFTPKDMRQRFCGNSCSAKWRVQTFGCPKHIPTEEEREKARQFLKNKWKEPEFRNKKTEYMKNHNPVYMPGVIDKAKKTRLCNGPYPNNFKYGNGKISKYEQLVFEDLVGLGFYYNYCINTKLARDAFPERHYSNGYKPDFVNIEHHLCIEIDGIDHTQKHIQKLDRKKEECLNFLGFTTIRFTHEQIDKGEFKKWLNSYQEKL